MVFDFPLVRPDDLEASLKGTELRDHLISEGHDIPANASRATCKLTYRLYHKGILEDTVEVSEKVFGYDRIPFIVKRRYEEDNKLVLRQECVTAGLRDDGDNWDMAIRLYCRDMGVLDFERCPGSASGQGGYSYNQLLLCAVVPVLFLMFGLSVLS